MADYGAFEAKNKLASLLVRVENGEEIVITRHGRPVARLVPSSGGVDRRQAESAAERIRRRAAGAALGAFSWEDLKRDRDEGRP